MSKAEGQHFGEQDKDPELPCSRTCAPLTGGLPSLLPPDCRGNGKRDGLVLAQGVKRSFASAINNNKRSNTRHMCHTARVGKRAHGRSVARSVHNLQVQEPAPKERGDIQSVTEFKIKPESSESPSPCSRHCTAISH